MSTFMGTAPQTGPSNQPLKLAPQTKPSKTQTLNKFGDPLKHPERMRSSMPQAAFYGDWGVSPTSRKSLSCHESPACRRVDSKKIVQNLEELSIDFVRFLE